MRHRGPLHVCGYCGAERPTVQGVKAHIKLTEACRKASKLELNEKSSVPPASEPKHAPLSSLSETPTNSTNDDGEISFTQLENDPAAVSDIEPPPPKRTRVEEVADEEYDAGGLPTNPFIDNVTCAGAGEVKGKGKTLFEAIHEARRQDGAAECNPWFPFANQEEWGLARWLMTSGLSHGEIDKYLKLEITRSRANKLSFENKRTFFKKIDSLPQGPTWQCEIFEAEGDEVDENGEPRTEVFELWKRNPLDCIQELLSNPTFAKHLQYAPERRYEDQWGKKPILSEMWSGTWWETIQKLLPKGATLLPVILASDKTQLSNFSGDKSAWPVYLTIGNLSKDVRRSPSSHATILIGYLPVTKLECFSKGKRSQLTYQLFHDCMHSLLAPLIEAGKNGVDMVCADGFIRRVFPIVAAYIADHPEQCLIACCQENFCPKCLVQPERRGEARESPMRKMEQATPMLRAALHGKKTAAFNDAGFRPINPFWADLPHCDIFTCLTPDLLHQLHKGMFKDHTAKWATACVEGKQDEVDRRFRTLPLHPDLRHFKKGISLVSQWTGNEYREMEKVFVGVIAGGAEPDVVKAVRAVLDFIFYAHFETHTEESLTCLSDAWVTFHSHKHVFVRRGIRKGFSNIPKLHSMAHYVESIRLLGSASGYSTECPERLHIDFAKRGYRASNRKQYIQQMTVWLDRQEAVRRFDAYLCWVKGGCRSELSKENGNKVGSAEGPSDHGEDDEDVGGEEEGGEEELDEVQPEASNEALYLIAKRPSYPNVSIDSVIEEFGATDFVRSLEEFLTKTSVDATSSDSEVIVSYLRSLSGFSTLPAYKQVKLKLPAMCQVTQRRNFDSIRATPSKLAKGLTKAVCGESSTVFARLESDIPNSPDSAASDTSPTAKDPLKGMAVAHVKLLFRLPPTLQHIIKDPLAYVEWFTPFQRYDDIPGMYSVAPSQRNHRRRASIIPVTDIVRSCHLIPNWGREADVRWTPNNVLDRCRRFYVNTYLRHSDFVLLRYLVDKWRKNK